MLSRRKKVRTAHPLAGTRSHSGSAPGAHLAFPVGPPSPLPRTLTQVGCCLILGSCCRKRNKPFPYPDPGSSGHIQRAQEHVVRTKRTLVPPEPPPGSSSPRTLPYGILIIQAQSLGQRAMRGARMRSRGSWHLSLCTATQPAGLPRRGPVRQHVLQEPLGKRARARPQTCAHPEPKRPQASPRVFKEGSEDARAAIATQVGTSRSPQMRHPCASVPEGGQPAVPTGIWPPGEPGLQGRGLLGTGESVAWALMSLFVCFLGYPCWHTSYPLSSPCFGPRVERWEGLR